MVLPRWPACRYCGDLLGVDPNRRVCCCTNPDCVACDPPLPGRGIVLVWENQRLDWLEHLEQLAYCAGS